MESNMEAGLAVEVRVADYDRFLAIQLAPRSKRGALYAVTAFHAALALVAETVSEPMLGHIRLAWWREALEEIAAGRPARNQPVVRGLEEIYSQSPAVFVLLFQMIDGRAADLDESLLATHEAWIAYLDATTGALHYAWALLLDPAVAPAQEAAIRREAQGYAITRLIRSIPYMHGQGFIRFSPSILQQAGVTSLAPSLQTRALAEILWAAAMRDVMGNRWDRPLRPLQGLSRLAKLHLDALQTAGYDPYTMMLSRLRAVWVITKVKYF